MDKNATRAYNKAEAERIGRRIFVKYVIVRYLSAFGLTELLFLIQWEDFPESDYAEFFVFTMQLFGLIYTVLGVIKYIWGKDIVLTIESGRVTRNSKKKSDIAIAQFEDMLIDGEYRDEYFADESRYINDVIPYKGRQMPLGTPVYCITCDVSEYSYRFGSRGWTKRIYVKKYVGKG